MRSGLWSTCVFRVSQAQRSYASEEDIKRALEEAWKQGVAHSMADGIMSQVEETKLRDRLDTAGMIQPA